MVRGRPRAASWVPPAQRRACGMVSTPRRRSARAPSPRRSAAPRHHSRSCTTASAADRGSRTRKAAARRGPSFGARESCCRQHGIRSNGDGGWLWCEATPWADGDGALHWRRDCNWEEVLEVRHRCAATHAPTPRHPAIVDACDGNVCDAARRIPARNPSPSASGSARCAASVAAAPLGGAHCAACLCAGHSRLGRGSR
jgi:hypothetical protein